MASSSTYCGEHSWDCARGARCERFDEFLRPGTRKPSSILDGEQDQFLIPDVDNCKIARPVSHIEAMIRCDIQLCSVP
jgi:hypothetical protein